MSRIKVIIFQSVAHQQDEALKIISDVNPNNIYNLAHLTDPSLLSLYLLAISINECSAINHDQCPLRVNNLNGDNVRQFKLNQKHYFELYERDVGAFIDQDCGDYDPYVAVMTINDIYVGHVYFWSIEQPIYNVMGIRSSLQNQYNRTKGYGSAITIYLLSAIRHWLIDNVTGYTGNNDLTLYRLVAPFPHMNKLALRLGMVPEKEHPDYDEEFAQDGYIGEGPITCEDEAACGHGSNPIANINEVLNGEDNINYELVDLC
jgi:hypothetical protein